jgi:transposase
MANRIEVAKAYAILGLWRQGHSLRRIARLVGVHRDTVTRYVRQAEDGGEAASPTLGSDPPKPAIATLGSDGLESPDDGHPGLEADGLPGAEPAKATRGADPATRASPTLGSGTVPSECEPFREVILEKLDQGLSGQRIWQDLVSDHGFSASYSSVKRFVRRLGKARPLPFRRMECAPGEEAQVDFGRGAPIVGSDGRRRTSWVLRVVLSHSRKGHSEALARQQTEPFLRALENAFRKFGGVPKVLVIDQLRAAVKHPDWFDPELNPKVEAFCRHYGVVILPTRPYTPRHKGKVERGVAYVKDNALKGRSFPSLAEENRFLADWEARIADHRIHGTTRQQVKALFERAERPALRPLPPDLFPAFHEAKRTVHRDGHVEVERAYYSVPPEYVGCTVWVRWDGRLVRLFNLRLGEIAVHPQAEAGRFTTAPAHLAAEKISSIERGATWLLGRVARIGPQSARWAEAMLEARGIEGLRVLQGLLALARKHRADTLENACESALSHQIFRLRPLRTLLKQPTTQAQFLEEHRLIRPLHHYGGYVRVSFRPTEEKEEEKAQEAFIASRATGREEERESPEDARAFPAVRPPAPALGSLATHRQAQRALSSSKGSGALSSGPAPANLPNPATPRNPEGDPSP